MDLAKSIRLVQVSNRDADHSSMPSDEVVLYNSDPNPERFIVSDADEELLIVINFHHFVDIQSITVYALPLDDDLKIDDASPPKQIHIFKLSHLNNDFDDIKKLVPQKSVVCSSQKLLRGQKVNLQKKTSKPLAFKKVKHLGIFIESNQNDTDFTYLHGISLNQKQTRLITETQMAINRLCYCSKPFVKLNVLFHAGTGHRPFCSNCFEPCMIQSTYICDTGMCVFHELMSSSMVICSECYSAKVPSKVLRNDVLACSGKGYNEKTVHIFLKVSMSLDRYS